MVACLTPLEIEQMLSGNMPAPERLRAEAHFGECKACRQRLESQRSDNDLFSDIRLAIGSGSDTTMANSESPGVDGLPPRSRRSIRDEIEGFNILSEIRRGGQGVVYQAVQLTTKRVVALKLLLAGSFATQRQRDRFQREIDLAASLHHPNIVTIFESGITSDGCPYFAMEHVDGPSLDTYIETCEFYTDDSLRLFRKICSAVGYAHGQGVIHRDLKPGNIRIDSDGEPHVLDFGLAKIAGPGSSDEASITGTGEFMGTLAYASPEQARGHSDEVDHRTDVYSLGVILYRMLTDNSPYPVDGPPAEVLRNIAELAPVPPSSFGHSINNDLETVTLKALDKDISRRYQSVDEFGDDVERFLMGEPVKAKRDSRAYILRKRSRKLVVQHRAATIIGLIAASIVLLEFVVEPLSGRWMNQWLSTTLMAMTSQPDASLDHVRIVGLSGQTDVQSIARAEKLRGVDRDKNKKSLRRLHGRLMEILARSDARVVVFDLTFNSESPYDEDFVKGVEALRDRGIAVIVAASYWWADDSAPPEVSRVIRPSVRWYGNWRMERESDAPWSVMLVMQRGERDPLPSLSLAAVAAYFEEKNTQVKITIGDDPAHVSLVYRRASTDADQSEYWTDEIKGTIASLEQWSRPPEFGLQEGDRYGTYIIQLPSDKVLDAATIDYKDVFHADDQELKSWFAGRVVVIADQTYAPDVRPTPDGREKGGYYGHAVAIEKMLSRLESQQTRLFEALSDTTLEKLVSAFLGLMTALVFGKRRWIALIAWAIGYLGACLCLASMFEFLWFPFVPFCALVIASELAASIRRVQSRAAA